MRDLRPRIRNKFSMAQREKHTDSALVGSGSDGANPQSPEESAPPEIKPISKVAGGVTNAINRRRIDKTFCGVIIHSFAVEILKSSSNRNKKNYCIKVMSGLESRPDKRLLIW